MKLHVLDTGQIVHTLDVTSGPITIGRAPGNTLTLRRASVSSHHALLTASPEGLWFRDLGSTNGVHLNGERVVEGPFGPRDVLRIGDVELRLEVSLTTDHAGALHVEQVDGPVSWALESGFSLPDHAHAVISHGPDGLWLDVGGILTALTRDTPFTVDDRKYQIVERPMLAATVPLADRFPYQLETDLLGGRSCLTADALDPLTVTSPNRVALLYVLTDGASRWVDDATIGTAVWGRSWSRHDPNNLNVLLHRLRNQAARGGYDKRFIERRRGEMRLRVEHATNL